MLEKQRNRNGFTLVELLVVISIIAVLTAVLSVNFMGARERARDAQKMETLNQMKNALRIYYNDHQSYPAVSSPVTSNDISSAIGTSYMPGASNIDFSYTYSQNSGGDGFWLKANLEAGAGTDDTDSQLKCGVDVGSTMDKVFEVCAN